MKAFLLWQQTLSVRGKLWRCRYDGYECTAVGCLISNFEL